MSEKDKIHDDDVYSDDPLEHDEDYYLDDEDDYDPEDEEDYYLDDEDFGPDDEIEKAEEEKKAPAEESTSEKEKISEKEEPAKPSLEKMHTKELEPVNSGTKLSASWDEDETDEEGKNAEEIDWEEPEYEEKEAEDRNRRGMKKEDAKKTGKKRPASERAAANTRKKNSEKTGKRNSSEKDTKASGKNTRTAKRQKAIKQKHAHWKVIGITSGVIVMGLVLTYIGISVFFMNHFYINTEINGHDFSAKTVEDVEEYMNGQVQDYTLTIHEKEKTDIIRGEDISLVYTANQEIEEALEKQNAFLWPKAFLEKNTEEITVKVSYDSAALDNLINGLQAVTAEQIPATNAYPKFDGNAFVIEPEVTGTAVNLDILRGKIQQYISEFRPELNMVEEGCYALPKYTSESSELQAAVNEMNKYLQASITYSMNEPVVVDRTLIANWVSADENMNVTLNEEAVRAWMTEFGKRFDTVGTTRTITSPQGRTVEVSGGTYGWSVDEDAEFVALVNSIKNGEVITKEPAYCPGQTAASHGPQDWGSTYAEVDIATQHMWYIVDGAVAMESDVVTGVPIPSKETTTGVYSILEKSLNKTLVGEIVPSTGKPEYETPVAFWMRITWSGIGFHDATWQPGFGGNLYSSGYGSHGCVNMPYDAAATLYNMMPEGTPVIVHY